MKNKLTDLNDALFAQLERLSADEISGDKLELEIQRTQSVVQVAGRIVLNARLQLDATKFVADANGIGNVALPAALRLTDGGAVAPRTAKG